MGDLLAEFEELASEAAACTRCAAMVERSAVLGARNGALQPRVLFVAEAPGRRGADRTRVPMCGDASGRAFDVLLASAGLTRADVFVTNAVLCNPRSSSGANRRPTAGELRNCADFLRRTLDLLRPPVIATLGATALAALADIEPHGLLLSSAVGKPAQWRGATLVPLYHPSPQVLISRRGLEQQIGDWRAVSAAAAGADG